MVLRLVVPALIALSLLVGALVTGNGDDDALATTGVVVTVAGDIATTGRNDTATGNLVKAVNPRYALTVGDNAYPNGTAYDFNAKYHPAWGGFKGKTRPVPGNHDYRTVGARGYFGYFADQVHGRPYYAFDAGAWRLYALNSEIPTGAGSPQQTWLRRDLAAHPGKHYLAYIHKPRFTCGKHAPTTALTALWQTLQDAGADLFISGHNHSYERFQELTAGGSLSTAGLRQFVVGTGGAGLYPVPASCPKRAFGQDSKMGILELRLQPNAYSWKFRAVGGAVLDSGFAATNRTY